MTRASLALIGLLVAAPASAQDPLGWNSPRALEMIEQARVRRELPRGDSTLRNYQARANGYVYFYLDRREDNERTLVKVDQIALELFWKRPNLTKQRIVGLRDVSRLPNRMYYHLDHLTVVQNNLGDVIRIGDGDEVRDVPHPAAPGADSIYDYRLADSVTLQLGGGQPDVRVYEVQVRPKRVDRSAFIGSVFVDRDAADIVRMTFTFTPVSYVDRRLDYINISLDNGLFGGKYWLPNEQSVEIRRQLPELDFAAGAIIKGRMRIAGYVFNEPIPDSVFFGRPVSALPEAQRESFPFPEDIYAGVNEEGLAPPPQMEDLRERAAELLGESRLSGLPSWRLYVPNASSVLRHNDAEGWHAGIGVAYVPTPTFRLDITGGYAFGLERPEATIAAHLGSRERMLTARAYINEPRDIGVIEGLPGVFNTFSSAFMDRDYTDYFFTRGAALDISRAVGVQWDFGARIRGEKQVSSGHFGESDFRPVLPVANGVAIEGSTFLRRRPAEVGTVRWDSELRLAVTRFDYDIGSPTRTFAHALLSANARHDAEDRSHALLASVSAGANFERDLPPQNWFYIGGRETLPGYHYRSLMDPTTFAVARVEASQSLWSPWIRLRALGYGGYANTARASGGLGLGLLWDVLRVDVVKGAHWQTIFSVRHDFWDLL